MMYLIKTNDNFYGLFTICVNMWRLVNNGSTCYNLWQLTVTQDNLWKFVIPCDILWQFLTIYDELWHLFTICDEWQWLMTTCIDLWYLVSTYDKLWQLLTARDDLWQLVMTSDNCDTLWQHVKPETLRRYWTNCKFWKSVTDRQTDGVSDNASTREACASKNTKVFFYKTYHISISNIISYIKS